MIGTQGINNTKCIICKTCTKPFRITGEIDYYIDDILLRGYCSEECFKKSGEYKKEKEDFLKFYKSLNTEQQEYLVDRLSLYSGWWDLQKDFWLKELKQ